MRICLLLACLMFSYIGVAQVITDKIKLNQLGFYENGPKTAIVTTDTQAKDFYVISSRNVKDTVYKTSLGALVQSLNSSTKTQMADFSRFKQKGRYFIYVPGIGNSYHFQIAADVHRSIAVSTLKGFYYMRVSMPLEATYAGKWARPTGHPDNNVLIHPSAASATRPAGTVISTPGGWYDAGDYNKYVVNNGITLGTLLSAYEDFPSYYDKLNTNIPESGNGVPDILDEIIYDLRWMLTMQDPEDGGVYNKCTNASFDGMVMPGVTTVPRYVVQKGTAATLDLAAVAGQASRILKKYSKQYPGLADSCLNAANKAWQWSLKNPAVEYNQNAMNKEFDPDVVTGGYGDRNFTDEWFWAATELFVSTKDKLYFDVLSKDVNVPMNIPSWGNVHMLGCYTLLRTKDVPVYAQALVADIKTHLIAYADGMIANVSRSAFNTVMGQTPRDFNWGSNSNAGNQGILLLNTYLLTKDKKYVDYALTNLDYLLGRNATGYCFVTGAGTKSTMHPHHRPSEADGIVEPVPGLLAGGPNPGKQDKCDYLFSEPETTYLDANCSYASNEITINWNAPIVYLANAIEALQKQVGY
jgi:endoglucanase